MSHGKRERWRRVVTRSEGMLEEGCHTVRLNAGGGLSHGKRLHRRGVVPQGEGTREGVCPRKTGRAMGLFHGKRGHGKGFVPRN